MCWHAVKLIWIFTVRIRPEDTFSHNEAQHRCTGAYSGLDCVDVHKIWAFTVIYLHVYEGGWPYKLWRERRRTFWHMRQTKTQISLRIRAVWLESSFAAWRHFASFGIQNAPGDDSDQTARGCRLIWIFTGHTRCKVRFLTLRLRSYWDKQSELLSQSVCYLSPY